MTALKASGGLGLSAIQIGTPLRIAVIRWGDEYVPIINPVVVKASSQMMPTREGCLSVEYGKKRVSMNRHKRIKVRYIDVDGATRTLKGQGVYSQLLQHEIDHMDGITIMAAI